MRPPRSALMSLVRLIAAGDTTAALRTIAAKPGLARAAFIQGASRRDANTYYLDAIGCYIYAGDRALHIAAAAYRHVVADALLAAGADVHARNRRGATPLHAAAVGMPGSSTWNPSAQTATIRALIAALRGRGAGVVSG